MQKRGLSRVTAIAGALLLAAAIPAVVAAQDEAVVIEIGDRSVTRHELDERFAIALRLLARRQGVSIADQAPAVIAGLRDQYLDKYATELVLLEEARRRQLQVSDAAVDAALGELFPADSDAGALLAEIGRNDADGRDALQRIVREEQTVELMTEALLREIKIPPGDVVTLHHDIKDTLATPEEVCVRHIQLAGSQEAEAVRAELEAGADFAGLAAERSTDQASAAGGGDLGCFERGPAGPRTEFERAAFAADEGELVGPVESRFGHHILVVYEHRMPRAPTLNEAYVQIERELAMEQLPGRISTLVEGSGLRVYPERYATSDES
jgi:parvulin-like peptidyl-prolyl isomerase